MVAEQLGMLSVKFIEFVQPVWSDITDPGQCTLGKFHSVRIDVARLHETARFFSASARVSDIDQPALIIHELVKIAPRTGE